MNNTGNNIQYLVAAYDGKESARICMYTWNEYNIVSQLQFNLKVTPLKKKKNSHQRLPRQSSG